MPKQQLIINKFEGGLHTDADPRDIADNEFSALQGFSVDSLGIIKTMGKSGDHATIDSGISQTEDVLNKVKDLENEIKNLNTKIDGLKAKTIDKVKETIDLKNIMDIRG